MENIVFNASYELTLEPFLIPGIGKYAAFVMGVIIYIFSASCNLTLMVLIIIQKNLHKPMYYILFSLPLNDFVGISAVFPRLLSDLISEYSYIPYHLCVTQAFLVHMYGGGVLFVLSAMSYDRYVAICKPLRYNMIMTPVTVAVIILLVWGLDFLLMMPLFAIQIPLPRCRSSILHVLCDNQALLKLTCINTTPNTIYGSFIFGSMQFISVSVQLHSYIKILIVCLSNKKSGMKSKAINTCVAQIVIFVLFEIVSTFTILSYRLKDASVNLRKFIGVQIFLFPPLFNPIVYGLYTNEIRNTLFRILRSKDSAK